MPTPIQLTGGVFQNILGSVYANGSVTFELSQDALLTSTISIGAGYKSTFSLDANGDIPVTPVSSILSNSDMLTAGTYYTVTVYDANGVLVWGPNPQTVPNTASVFNLGAWVPGQLQ